MNWLHHLLDPSGFPTITKYGRGWEPWLITVFVLGKGLAAVAYLIFIGVFASFQKAWKEKRLDMEAASVHAPRVALVYLISVCFDFSLQVLTIAGFWWPAYRFLGLFALLSTTVTFIAALKSLWALTWCVQPQQKGSEL